MNPKRTFLLLSAIFLLAASLACNLSTSTQNASPTPDTSTPTSTPAPTDTATPDGISVSFSETSFTIPTDLASGAQPETVASMVNETGPGWDTAPAYTRFTLENYQLQDTAFEPRIYVYPAAEYEAVNNGAAESLKRLRALISDASLQMNSQTVPFVPFFNATQIFKAQPLRMKFQNGSGIRIITQYEQAPMPVSNHDLVYQFEGLTGDGKYYIIALFPVNFPTLQAESRPDSPVPADGIPYNKSDPAAYFEAVTQKLNAATPESFTPNLTTLDALIQSINVTKP